MNWRRATLWLIVLGMFYMMVQPAMDLDLGWHLRYGQYFWQTGKVLKDNILSFVWPDYKWVQASWGFDVLLYLIFKVAGLWGVSMSGAVFSLGVFWLAVRPMSKHPLLVLLLAMIFISVGSPLFASGMRSQTPSALFFVLTLIIGNEYFEDRQKIDKRIFWLPVLFLGWANMHGGFSLGLLMLFIIWMTWAGLGIIKRGVSAKKWWLFGGVLFLSSVLPLINPWGTRIYEETFKHSTNKNLTVIVEWMPLYNWWLETWITGVICGLALVVLLWRKKLTNVPYFLALIFGSYLAFSALRFLIILAIMLVYFLGKNMAEIDFKFVRNKWTKLILTVIFLGLIVVDSLTTRMYFAPLRLGGLPTTWKDLCDLSQDCDEGLAAAMNNRLPVGNGYNPYNLGGYLSWRVPAVKTFVDGRMAAWEDDTGKTPPVIEGDWVYMQKSPVTFRKFDSQYRFSWVVVPTETYIADYLNDLSKNGGWTREYTDRLYSYYVKN